jgi:hypothetical protein
LPGAGLGAYCWREGQMQVVRRVYARRDVER